MRRIRKLAELGRPTSLRHLSVPRLDAAPLDDNAVTYDDLIVHRSWREYDDADPGAVRYFCYELSQRDPGPATAEHEHFFKALRLLRVTRVPRYLRQQPNAVIDAQRDMLTALRERGVLFVNMIAKSPELPMIFSYGVQAVGATVEEAKAAADEAYEVLRAQLDGTFQQLEYQPITVDEGEALVRYQAQWRHVAVARGRPMPADGAGNVNANLDGNRTDVTSHAAHQLESFIRGMSDRPFLLTMITTPISPDEMIKATRNLSKKLSEVRSEQQGQRAVTAGVALPLGFGASFGDTHGSSHSTGAMHGVGMSDATSQVITEGQTFALSQGETLGVSEVQTIGESLGVTEGVTEGISEGVSHGASHGTSVSQTDSQMVGLSYGETVGESITASESVGESLSYSQSASESMTESLSRSLGVSESSSLAHGATRGESFSESINDSRTAGVTHTEGTSQSVAETRNQTITIGSGESAGTSEQAGTSSGSSTGGSLLVLNGGKNEGMSETEGSTTGWSSNVSSALSGGGTLTDALNESWANNFGRTVGIGATQGVSTSESMTATSGVGRSESLGASSAVGQSFGESLSQGATRGQSMSQGASHATSASQSMSQGSSLSRGESLTESVSANSARSLANSQSTSTAVSSSQARGLTSSVATSQTAGTSQAVAQGATAATSENQSLSDSYVVALSHAAQRTSSLGAIPSFGISISRQTFDETKRIRGDFIEAQLNRYLEGIRSGGFFYQMFLVCPDRPTLAGGAGLLKSAFWGDRDKQLPQPFHVVDRFEPAEAKRLLDHARAFTAYRKTEQRMELVEPYVHSTYLTPTEGAVFAHPPVSSSIGLLANVDSMPVFEMPSDRTSRDLYLGHLVNGERAKVTDTRFGIDLSELTHTLVAGATGSGKTTTTLRMITEAVRARREVVTRSPDDPLQVTRRQVPAGALCLDWADSFRDLASVVEPERFNFYSVMKPHLGRFRFNPLAIPDENMDPSSWASTIADLFMLSYSLGEVSRSIVWESIQELFAANRLQPYTLRPAVIDDDGIIVRPAIELRALDPSEVPDGGIASGPGGSQVANVFTCPALSRLVGIPHLAVLVAAQIEELARPGAANLTGTNMRDRLQSVWRRIMYFAPGEQLALMFAPDPSLDQPEALTLTDLIDADRGLVTVIETEGLDYENRRFVLGSVLMALWRYAQYHGDGVFDHDGSGPGTFVVLEEAHELLGTQPDDDRATAATRDAIYESLFRRARKYGLRLVACVQNASKVPAAITSNTSTVIAHKQWDADDKRSMAHLFNWKDGVGQHFREVRYLGEMPDGWAIVRLNPKTHFTQAAPSHVVVDPVDLPPVPDEMLARAAAKRERERSRR